MMNLRYKKHVRILNEILNYCHQMGGYQFHIDFIINKQTSHITVKSRVDKITQDELDDLYAQICIPRQHEIEENYWNVSNDDNSDNTLFIVGVMTDRVNVDYDEETHVLSIHVERDDLGGS